MLKKNVAITFAGQLASFLLALGVAVVLVRALGTAGRGLLALAILIPMIVATFARLGQESVNSTFAGLYREHRTSLFVQTLLFTVFGALLCVLVVCAFFFWLPIPRGNFSQLSDRVIWAGVLLGPSMIFGMLMISLVRGVGKIGAAAALQVFQGFARLGFCLLLVVGLNYGLEAAVWALAAGPVLAGVLAIWVIRNDISIRGLKFEYWLFKKSLRFGFAVGLATFAGFLVYRIDRGILAYFVNENELGLYVVAVGLAERLRLLPNSVSLAFLPHLANDLDAHQKQVPTVFRCTMVISVASMAIVGILGPPALVLLFGMDCIGSIWPFLILLPGVAALGGASVLSSDLLAREKPRYSTIVGWSMLGLCVALNLILIPIMGIAGAAATSSITYLTALAMVLLFYRRESGVSLSQMRPRWSDVALVLRLTLNMMRSLLARGRQPALSDSGQGDGPKKSEPDR
ncbi:MAG: flippase [Desulfobacteraceae bacterium]|nr:flippase [Desulfobacteraceae bacterium]